MEITNEKLQKLFKEVKCLKKKIVSGGGGTELFQGIDVEMQEMVTIIDDPTVTTTIMNDQEVVFIALNGMILKENEWSVSGTTVTINAESARVGLTGVFSLFLKTPALGGGSGGDEEVFTTIVEISSAQLLALDTTPVELVPAQGAGTYIAIENYIYRYEYGTEDYDFNPTPSINGVAPIMGGLIGVNLGGNTSRVIRSSNSDIILSENTPITLEYSGAAPTQGDGTLKLILTYRIIEL